MTKRWLTGGTVLAFLLVPFFQPQSTLAADPDTTGPTAVVRIKSIDGLIDDALYLAKLVGREEEAKQGEGFLRSLFPNDESAGIDSKRPIGLYGVLDNALPNSSAVLMVPVASDKAFLDLLNNYGVEAKKDEKTEVYSATTALPVPVPIFFRLANKYAYITAQNPNGLAKDKLLDPAKVLSSQRNAVLAATFYLERIPRGMRDLGLGFMDMSINQQAKFPPGASKAEKALQQEVIKSVSKNIGSLLKEGSSVEVVLDLDRKAGELLLEAIINGKKGSRLATEITDLSQAKSLFSGLSAANPAANFLAHVMAPENVREALTAVVEEGIQKQLQKEQNPDARALQERFLKSLVPTMKAGEVDVIARAMGPASDGHYTGLAGIKVVDGKEIEDALRAIVAVLPPQLKEPIKLDAESAGDVKIHRLDVQARFDNGGKELVGNHPIYVAIRPNMVVTGVGPDGLKAVKEALKAQPATGGLLQLDVSMARLAPGLAKIAAGRGDKNAAEYIEKAAKDAFAGGNQMADQIHVVVSGGGRLDAKVTIKAPVLVFLSKLAPRPAQ
jgi:hypothetical protein